MSPDGRTLLRELALLIGVPLVAVIAICVWLVPWADIMRELDVRPWAPADGNVFAAVEGRWDWTGNETFCEGDWHDITFSPDRTTMAIEHAKPVGDSAGTMQRVWVYDILESDSSRIRGRIRGEDRLDDAGNPIVWDLVLTGPDEYRWRDTTWSADDYTGAVRRCPERTSTGMAASRSNRRASARMGHQS